MRKRSSNRETLGSASDDAARKNVGDLIRHENHQGAARSRRAGDANQLAVSIVAQATGQADEPEPDAAAIAAVMRAMGRRGGLKGGKARAATLSPAKRKAIAKKAAAARWGHGKS